MAQRTRSRASGASSGNTGDNDDNGGTIATAEAPEKEGRDGREFGGEGFLNLADLKEMSISKLTSIAKGMMSRVRPACANRS
jgi:hypothetical protein